MISSVENFNLRLFNTFRVDVCCDEWVEYTSVDDVPVLAARLKGRRYMSIGSGSKLLFTADYHGTVIHSRILDVATTDADDATDSVIVRAGAGVEMDALIAQCCAAGLWGLENLSGIPGEVGASAVQNVGAYGVEASDAIDLVEAYDCYESRFVSLSAKECRLGYRRSMFKEHPERYIITHVSFRLSRSGYPKLTYGPLRELEGRLGLRPMDVRNAVRAIRDAKLPAVEEIGSAGSFFMNPVVERDVFEEVRRRAGDEVEVPHYELPDGRVKIPAAWLIDSCGLKNASVGGASVWHLQPLVIVNRTGKASPDDILELDRRIVERVRERYGVELSPEVILV